MRGLVPSHSEDVWRAACVFLLCVRTGAKRGVPLGARPHHPQQQQQPDKVFPSSRCADTPRGTRPPRASVTVRARTNGSALSSSPTPAPFPRGCLRALEPAMAARAPSRSCHRSRGAAAARVPVTRSRGRRSTRPTTRPIGDGVGQQFSGSPW